MEQFKTANDGMQPNILTVGTRDGPDLIDKTLGKIKGDAAGDVFVVTCPVRPWRSAVTGSP